MSKIDALYEAAQKATMGPWRRSGNGAEGPYVYGDEGNDAGPVVCVLPWDQTGNARDDATFIALADPQTVMALVAVYRAAKPYASVEGNPRLRAAIEKVEALG